MLDFLRQRSFLLALVAILFAGIGWPATMQPIAKWLPSDVIVAAVTFIMALPLVTRTLLGAVRHPGPSWLGAAINSGIAPPLGWIGSQFLPQELAVGVVLATSVPCTLATAAVWTRRAGGHDAVAFLVTVITNLSCFLVVPVWLWLLVGVSADVNYGQIMKSLLLLVVLPIVCAQLLRQWPTIGRPATKHRQLLSRLAQFGVLLMVFVGAVACGEKLQAANDSSVLSIGNMLLLVTIVTGVHIALLLIATWLCRVLKIERGDAIPVAFGGSQKTLMVGAYLANAVGPLAILPMVAYHAAQLVVDTLVADWLSQSQSSADTTTVPVESALPASGGSVSNS